MAAYIHKEDLITVFNQAVQRFKNSSHLSAQKNKSLFYKEMTDDINATLEHHKISNRFLQKKIVSEAINNFNTSIISININDLNALYSYAIETPNSHYEKKYRVSNKKRELATPANAKTVSEDDAKHTKKHNRLLLDFPWGNPNYPSTPSVPFQYEDFTRIWIKEESYNVTGTVKDRWSWGVLKFYKSILKDYDLGQNAISDVPRLGMISTGSAAISLQHLLSLYKLPPLKVIVHNKLPPIASKISSLLKEMGSEVISGYGYEKSDFSPEHSRLLLGLTEDDIDLTFPEYKYGLSDLQFSFYEWLAVEILDQNPDFCFIPFGSGLLYHSILTVAKREVQSKGTGKCLLADPRKIANCVFYGAMPKKGTFTNLDKLSAKYFPQFPTSTDEYIAFLNPKSSIQPVNEHFLHEARRLAVIRDYKVKQTYGLYEHFILAEDSGLAGMALFLEMKRSIPLDAKVLIINTGKVNYDKFTKTEKSEIENLNNSSNKMGLKTRK